MPALTNVLTSNAFLVMQSCHGLHEQDSGSARPVRLWNAARPTDRQMPVVLHSQRAARAHHFQPSIITDRPGQLQHCRRHRFQLHTFKVTDVKALLTVLKRPSPGHCRGDAEDSNSDSLHAPRKKKVNKKTKKMWTVPNYKDPAQCFWWNPDSVTTDMEHSQT